MNGNNLTIKENFDEEDLSDDVDDEVFVRDGKHSNQSPLMTAKRAGDEQPLMPLRRKFKQRQNLSSPEVCSRQPCNIYNCLLPVYFGIATVISIAVLMLMYVFLVEKLPLMYDKFQLWSSSTKYQSSVIVPCSNLKLDDIWTKKIPTLTSDSQIKLIDIDKDNISDVIIGIGTEYTFHRQLQKICISDFERKHVPCLGAVIAFNGKTGNIIWQCWLQKMVLALHCEFEITGDAVDDCIATGKGGLFVVINGYDGSIIWKRKAVSPYELYNVLIVQDINQDNYFDIIAGHYLKENENHVESNIFIVSGMEDKTLQQIRVPNNEPILHAPQILMDSDGNENVCFVTGDLYRSGGIYIISLQDLLKGDSTKIRMLYHFNTGILASPLMVDMNLDGVQDIIFFASNSAFILNGINYELIWNVSLHNYVPRDFQITVTSTVTPAYFNNDWIPDLLIMFPVGSSFPEYYYSVILVLDGKTGKSLLRKPITRSSVTDTVSGITLSFSGAGNDAFVYWTASCKHFIEAKTSFTFKPAENKHTFADLCCLRFNATSQLQLYALNQHIEPPGVLLYAKEFRKNISSCLQQNGEDNDQFAYNTHAAQENARMSFIQEIFPFEKNNVDEKQYNDINEDEWKNAWKLQNEIHKKKNGRFGLALQDNDQNQVNDYETHDNHINIGKQAQYDYSKFYGNVLTPNENKYVGVLPKVSASGVITKSFDGNDLDIILMHHEVIADNDVCVIIDEEKKCIQKKLPLPSITKNPMKENAILDDVSLNSNQHYLHKENFNEENLYMGNLYISRHRLSCSCDFVYPKNKEVCSTLLPYEKQSYPAYLGRFGNSAYRMRNLIV